MINKKVEVLSPAGDMERFKYALKFGADAIYLAGNKFGMRTAPSNFNREELIEAVNLAHDNDVKVYITCNIVARNKDIVELPEFLKFLNEIKVDAIIVSDLGVLSLIKKYAPDIEIHISTQAGVANFETANMLYDMGAKRVVLARELSFEEIREIREKTSKELEIETFVHGAMCVSFSGRCLISAYLAGRDANKGDCAAPCRWKYYLNEEKRPGLYFPVEEDNTGTYFFNSKDLCMIEYIPELIEAGISSLKIEGRAKSAYYTAVVTNAYKSAVNDYYSMGENYKLQPWIKEEVNKISHRQYSTGFFFGNEPGQVYDTGGYVRDYDVVAICNFYEDGYMNLSQKNKFSKGEVVEILEPSKEPYEIKIDHIYDEWNNEIETANHAEQRIKIPTDIKVGDNAIIRRRKV